VFDISLSKNVVNLSICQDPAAARLFKKILKKPKKTRPVQQWLTVVTNKHSACGCDPFTPARVSYKYKQKVHKIC
jgi:hypothetical protein